jgi:hypothetical protein
MPAGNSNEVGKLRTIWIVDAHRGDGKRFVVPAVRFFFIDKSYGRGGGVGRGRAVGAILGVGVGVGVGAAVSSLSVKASACWVLLMATRPSSQAVRWLVAIAIW